MNRTYDIVDKTESQRLPQEQDDNEIINLNITHRSDEEENIVQSTNKSQDEKVNPSIKTPKSEKIVIKAVVCDRRGNQVSLLSDDLIEFTLPFYYLPINIKSGEIVELKIRKDVDEQILRKQRFDQFQQELLNHKNQKLQEQQSDNA